MSAGFRAVQWNRAKLVYDGVLLAGVTLYIGTYILLSVWLDPPKDEPAAIDVRIRAFGTCAFFMLTIILSIGRWRGSIAVSCHCSTIDVTSAC